MKHKSDDDGHEGGRIMMRRKRLMDIDINAVIEGDDGRGKARRPTRKKPKQSTANIASVASKAKQIIIKSAAYAYLRCMPVRWRIIYNNRDRIRSKSTSCHVN